MMILETGRSNKSVRKSAASSKGYSLLELMVVMVVIGVISSVAALSFGNYGADFGDKTIQRLKNDVQLLSNEAIVRSESLALGFSDEGYAFFKMSEEDSTWVAVENDRFLKPRKFELPVKVKMAIGEDEVSLGAQGGEPQIIALPTGEVTAFHYSLENPQDSNLYEISFDGLGRSIREKDEKDTAQ